VLVEELWWDPAQPRPGDAVRFGVRVLNRGGAATPDVVGVGYFVDGHQVGWASRDPMGPSERSDAFTMVQTWTPPSAGTFSVRAVVDDIDRFREADEGNNALQRALQVAGDIEPPPEGNRFGIGLVGPGSAADMDLAADLVGPGGMVKLIFPGITRDTQGPQPDWVAGLQAALERQLVAVIRLGPPWGDRRVRHQADDGSFRTYRQLAAAYRRVVEGLPLPPAGGALWLEIHNEPNLCYEWVCDRGSVPGDWIGYEQVAGEYACMLRDVANALHAVGDPRLRVINGGLAPGGTTRCECGGEGWEGGITSREFLGAMRAAVPDIFERLDGFATHSYPAEGEGWGFFVPYDRAGPGLLYMRTELAVVGRALPVLNTETGWSTAGGGSREQIAEWTVSAYRDIWLTEDGLLGVMPFMLRDPAWDAFAWVAGDGRPYPVYEQVRRLRCQHIPGRCP